jgi:serine/threonine protein kinase
MTPVGVPIRDLETFMKAIPGILSGLAFAHSQGVVHRDVRQENMILVSTPSAHTGVLIDWEFAVTKDENPLDYCGTISTASNKILDALNSNQPVKPSEAVLFVYHSSLGRSRIHCQNLVLN